MTFSFHPEAEKEFRAAIEYYEDREVGLGYDFSVEVFTAIQNAAALPHAWPVMEEDIHRCLVNRLFPHGLSAEGFTSPRPIQNREMGDSHEMHNLRRTY